MSQNQFELAGAGDEKKPEPVQQVREIAPIVFFDKNKGKPQTEMEETADMYDFRAIPRSAEAQGESAPKADSSAQESVASSESLMETETGSSENTENPAPVEKDSTKSKESESGSQASSSKTSAGKSAQTA